MTVRFFEQQNRPVVVFDVAVKRHLDQRDIAFGIIQRLADDHEPLVVQVEPFGHFMVLFEVKALTDLLLEARVVGFINDVEFAKPVLFGQIRNLGTDFLLKVGRDFGSLDCLDQFLVIIGAFAIQIQQLASAFVHGLFGFVIPLQHGFQDGCIVAVLRGQLKSTTG